MLCLPCVVILWLWHQSILILVCPCWGTTLSLYFAGFDLGFVINKPTCWRQLRSNSSIHSRCRDQPVAVVINAAWLGCNCFLQHTPNLACLSGLSMSHTSYLGCPNASIDLVWGGVICMANSKRWFWYPEIWKKNKLLLNFMPTLSLMLNCT